MNVKEAKELKGKMEEDIAAILLRFESETGLKPGTVFSERVEKSVTIDGDSHGEIYYKVNIPVNL